MDSKTASIVSYLGIIGWLVAFFTTKDSPTRDDFSKYHLKQSLGLGIIGIVFGVVINILAFAIPSLALIFSLLWIALLVLLILGIMNAVNGKKAPLPVIGKMFEDKFDFI